VSSGAEEATLLLYLLLSASPAFKVRQGADA
jgi:hypothetical protein